MENCCTCASAADLRCPKCGALVCSAHMEPRYAGPERGLAAKNICPSCWKGGKVTLETEMERVCVK